MKGKYWDDYSEKNFFNEPKIEDYLQQYTYKHDRCFNIFYSKTTKDFYTVINGQTISYKEKGQLFNAIRKIAAGEDHQEQTY